MYKLLHNCTHLTPVLVPGKSHGRRSLVGCSPWGNWELDTTQWLHFHFSLSCIGEGNGNPLQCSCLENPRDGGAWWAAIYGVAHDWSDLAAAAAAESVRKPTGPWSSEHWAWPSTPKMHWPPFPAALLLLHTRHDCKDPTVCSAAKHQALESLSTPLSLTSHCQIFRIYLLNTSWVSHHPSTTESMPRSAQVWVLTAVAAPPAPPFKGPHLGPCSLLSQSWSLLFLYMPLTVTFISFFLPVLLIYNI